MGSAQANIAQSQTLPRPTLREVEFFELKTRISSQNQIFQKKNILACLSGAQVGWIHSIKKCQKSSDTAALNEMTIQDLDV